MNTAHIHDVIFLVQELDGKLNTNTLLEEISKRMGKDVKFTSCSGVPFDKEEALPFLLEREKVLVNSKGLIEVHPSMKMCNSHLQ